VGQPAAIEWKQVNLVQPADWWQQGLAQGLGPAQAQVKS
jgi:hypothetical protein